MMEQPELDLGLTPTEHRVWVGEGEHARTTTKAPDPEGVVWRRLHTAQKCHECIDEMQAGGKMRVAWNASYTRTENGVQRLLCFTHAAPLRHGEGLPAQKPENHG